MNTRWNFERFADEHVLARQRKRNIYFGCVFFKHSAFKTLKARDLTWNWRGQGQELLDYNFVESERDPGKVRDYLEAFVNHRIEETARMEKQRKREAAAQRLARYGHVQKRRAKVLAWVKREEEKAERERRRLKARGQGRRM